MSTKLSRAIDEFAKAEDALWILIRKLPRWGCECSCEGEDLEFVDMREEEHLVRYCCECGGWLAI